MQGKQGKGLSK